MNEYYKKRYNISNYFLNIDTDDYYNIMCIILMLLIVNIVIYTIYPIIFIMTKKDINFTITIYIIFLIVFYIISYNLYISLKDICSNELLSQYYNYYKLLNIIFKENFYYFKKEFTDNLIKNINNIENVYDNKANELLNSSNDILKYYKDIENIYTQRLYFTFDKFKFLHKNLGFIDTKPNNDLNDENNYYIDLKIIEENYSNSNEKKKLLHYINSKYNTNFKYLYKTSPLTDKFNKNMEIIINNFKNNIYNYLYISIFFIIVSLQNLLINFNIVMINIYISVIILLFIFMYYYTNT